MKKYWHLSILLMIDFLFLILIFFIFKKIFNLKNIKGLQITQINKNNILLYTANNNLKFFYEPKPNHVEKWQPSWLQYEVQNTINEDSLNERYNYEIIHPKDVYRIITMGDSFTFGQYVKTSENYSELLEDTLNSRIKCTDIFKFEVINLGVYGYDASYAIERFINRGIKYQPNIVIWLLNDFNLNTIRELEFPIKEKLIKSGIPEFNTKTGKYEASDKAIEQLTTILGKNGIINYHKENFKNLISNYAGDLFIISMSGLKYNSKDHLMNISSLEPKIKYYDNLFDTTKEEKYRFLDYHPNQEGHKKISRDILNYLLKNNLKDCQEL